MRTRTRSTAILEVPIDTLAFAILIILLLSNAYSVLRDKRQYAVFKTFTETNERQRVLRSWVLQSVVFYGVVPLICLFAIGQGQALLDMPESLRIPSDALNTFITANDRGFFGGILYGFSMVIVPLLLVGHTAAALIRTCFQHKNYPNDVRPVDVEGRDIAHLFPRNADERFWTALLSISAGITEELGFRLLIPVLIVFTTGSWLLAITLSTVWFGLAHYYQGWGGVLLTMVVGVLFFFVYLLTQSIWLVMLIHAILDLNDLAFAPWLAERLARSRNSQ